MINTLKSYTGLKTEISASYYTNTIEFKAFEQVSKYILIETDL